MPDAPRANAALYLHPDGYNASHRRLLGRRSAGESFLRGFLRNAAVDRFYFYNPTTTPHEKLAAFVAGIEQPTRPVSWISVGQRQALAEVGVLQLPAPDIPREAFQRRRFGQTSYAITGMTHTTASALVMKLIPELLIAPVADYDALVCTSSAVRASVETQLSIMRSYMAGEYGARRRPEAIRTTIPLGLNVADFAHRPEAGAAWRERLAIPPDGLVVLYVGRFNARGKMNPALMAMALERAALRTGRTLYWVNSGWAESEKEAAHYHQETRKLCPSVVYLHVDGREADARFGIWSAADIFISFSDNIQETFGLTPIEAMAAGLPSVVSDWDGYKDTVRHALDGFRIPTVAPPPGRGEDLAFAFGNELMPYDQYIGAAAQTTAVDLEAAELALTTLIERPQVRARQGAAAQARAREVFDWAAVIPQYQALWAEQDARRRAALQEPGEPTHPYFPDPFLLFAGYPTRHIAPDDRVTLSILTDWASAKARLDAPLAAYDRYNRPIEVELRQMFEMVAERGMTVAEILERFPAARRPIMERGLLWMARHDVLALAPARPRPL